jgi:UDP-glucose 6-dehydrogenase
MKIGFMGVGKLGLPIALAAETKGHEVVAYDPSPRPAELLAHGFPSEEGFEALRHETRIRFVGVDEVVLHSDIVFVAVQTPHEPKFGGAQGLSEERADFDYSYLRQAVQDVAESAQAQQKEIVLCVISTVLPGTSERELKPLLNEYTRYVYNPAFPAMGTVIHDYLNPEFVLIGVDDEKAARTLEDYYAGTTITEKILTSVSTAELAKVGYNVFISFKIATINALMEICEKMGADVDGVSRVLCSARNRIVSPAYLKGGMGDGGPCLPPGGLVFTSKGPRAVESVRPGDWVLSEGGKLRRVTDVMSRRYEGEMVTIKVMGMPEVRFTSNHRVYAAKDGRRIRTGSVAAGRAALRDTRQGLLENLGPLEEVAARDLSPGDDYLHWPSPVLSAQAVVPPPPPHVSEAYLELAGWYLSEGHLELSRSSGGNFRSGRVGFTLHAKELGVASRLGALCREVAPQPVRGRGSHGRGPRIHRKGPRSIVLRYGSVKLARLLLEDFGSGAEEKALPDWALFGDHRLGLGLLWGMWQGDGQSNEKGIEFSTISPDLAYGSAMILEREGISCSVVEVPPRTTRGGQRHRRSFNVRVRNAIYLDRLSQITGLPNRHKMQEKRYPGYLFRGGGGSYRKVRKVSVEEYGGLVYNLTVEGTHNYATPAGLVANCHPRDAIAMSWLSREIDLSRDIFEDVMLAREAQTAWLANLTVQASREKNLPIVLLGTTFKKNAPYEDGSPARLFLQYLHWRNADVLDRYDPHVHDVIRDPEKPYDQAAIFFIGTNHDIWPTWKFPQGSVVLDPWGYMPDQEGVEVRRIGRSK